MAIPGLDIAIGGTVARLVSKVIEKAGSLIFGNKKDNDKSNTSGPTRSLTPAISRPTRQEIVYVEKESRRENEFFALQQELANYRKAEVEVGIKVAAAEAKRQEWALQISEKNLELKQRELQLVEGFLEHNKEIQQHQRAYLERGLQLRKREVELIENEFQARRELGQAYLEVIRESKAKEIEVKLLEIQEHWNAAKWPGFLSQQDTVRIFGDASKRHRLVLILSQPEVTPDCPQELIHSLPGQVSNELKQFLEANYPADHELSPVQFFGKFFERAVSDTEVTKLEVSLAPIPTAVIYSYVNSDKVYLSISLSGTPQPTKHTIEWEWEDFYQQSISGKKQPKQALREVRTVIEKLHEWLAAFVIDLYYISVNPNHEPRIYALEEGAPREIQVLIDKLRELQQSKQGMYLSEVKQIASEAKMQQLLEEEAKRAAEEAERVEAEENLRLGDYVELRNLLRSGKWYEADEKTLILLLKEVESSSKGVLDEESSSKLPVEKLMIVDALWMKYSDGRFGLSVQKRMFEECASNLFSFIVHIGWTVNYNDPTLRFSLKSPEGHLPARIYSLKSGAQILDKWAAANAIFGAVINKFS